MLEDFVVAHRTEIIERCRRKVSRRSDPPPTPEEIDQGVPMFVDQLVAELRNGPANLAPAQKQMTGAAAARGRNMLLQGFTASQVVHNYSDVCQSITELTIEKHAAITADDFRMLNRCLDDAIAAAITEHGRVRDFIAVKSAAVDGNRLQVLVTRLRSSLQVAVTAFAVVKAGQVGVVGSTAALLDRSLRDAADSGERLRAAIAEKADVGQ